MVEHVRCDCCQNPWNQENDGFSANFGVVCGACMVESDGKPGIDPRNFDNSVQPGENFYLWSNGTWMKNNPIPPEYTSWNTFIELRDLNQNRLKSILDELELPTGSGATVSTGGAKSEEVEKLSNFYNGFMNVAAIDSSGIHPLIPLFDLVRSSSLTEVLAALHSKFGVKAFFNIYGSPDKKNSEHSLATLTQAGLGLPDRDYYFDEEKQGKRDSYQRYLRQLFALLGSHGLAKYTDSAEVDLAVADVFRLEKLLATAQLTRTEMRDPEATYNKMSPRQLKSRVCAPVSWETYLTRGPSYQNFDWETYFSLIGKPVDSIGDVNVTSVAALRQAMSIMQSEPRAAVEHYLVYHIAKTFSPHMSSDFCELHFQFFGKELEGQMEQKPRWKRALDHLENALGDALGKLYVARHFAGDAKPIALRIVEQVRCALRDRLAELDWMSSQTKEAALRKMEKFNVKIGFPDKWVDYSKLQIIHAESIADLNSDAPHGGHLHNLFSVNQFQFQQELDRMNAPVDRTRWFMTPQTVNAYYHPSLNEIVFPAAILQPPFFDVRADDAVNLGSLGAVVGHEMTHGFDDQGRKYDENGNMINWWTSEDGLEYEKRVEVMVRQAESFQVHGIPLKGKLTCGENIADLGGVRLALRALSQLPSGGGAGRINGFTPQQRLFLAWAQVWRGNVTEERAKQLITIDPHGPGELRCNGTLSNIEEFFAAFAISPACKMFRPAAERVQVW